jgi:lantibiotic modifying enzyme
MLYDPEKFEQLTDEGWNEERAREGIRAIVADAERAFDPDTLWPAQEWDVWGTTPPLKGLYIGAAGVVWALDTLRRRGYADVRIDLVRAARRALELWKDEPDLGHEENLPTLREPSLILGESGILTVLWRLAPSADVADRLHARVRENKDNAADEIFWGAPGTMLAARAMHAWTGEDRWLDALTESSDALRARRDDDGLWTNQLYGQTFRSLGTPHGAVGNTLALGEPHPATRETLAREAVVENGLANWPSRIGQGLERDGEIRLQWCCGAPGIVTSASTYLDEELLLAGAELIWRAGPHGADKGPGICHGTAGNGYALLKTFERTGDEHWLERARRFAVHALGQTQNRYSLWTGDVGVALYAADCLDARAAYPILDTWD